MREIKFKETQPISQREYSPTRYAPLDLQEILVREVKREDEINHANAPIPEIPKFKKEKVENPQWVKHFIKGTLGQLMP